MTEWAAEFTREMKTHRPSNYDRRQRRIASCHLSGVDRKFDFADIEMALTMFFIVNLRVSSSVLRSASLSDGSFGNCGISSRLLAASYSSHLEVRHDRCDPYDRAAVGLSCRREIERRHVRAAG